ncbi:MAG: hypothetical protein ACI4MN_03170 [Candidatus Coproplasma sp.]
MNKPLKIHPISILRFVWLFIWIFFISLSGAAIVVVFLEGEFEAHIIIITVCAFVMLFVSLYFFVVDFRRGIRFDDKGIEVMADISDRKGVIVKKIQYELCLKYEDITDIGVDFTKNDTHDKEVPYIFVDMPNIVLTQKNGKKERINVYYYSLRQKIQIIDILRLQVEKYGINLGFSSGKEFWENALKKE